MNIQPPAQAPRARPWEVVVRIARRRDRERIVLVVDAVASERRHLQTDRYRPTPAWEQALREGLNTRCGILLLAVEVERQIVGFGRLTADWAHPRGRAAGNIGIALLPAYRGRGVGTLVLAELIGWAPSLGFRMLDAAILTSNVCSLKLFSKYGFRVAAIRETSVPFRQDAVEEALVELELVKEGWL